MRVPAPASGVRKTGADQDRSSRVADHYAIGNSAILDWNRGNTPATSAAAGTLFFLTRLDAERRHRQLALEGQQFAMPIRAAYHSIY